MADGGGGGRSRRGRKCEGRKDRRVRGGIAGGGGGNGGGGGGGLAEREGTVREKKLCRSMKNCTGILPPQLTVWEADLISGESIRLEL